MLLIRPNIRNDAAGSGEFWARRGGGKRPHLGVDFLAKPGEAIVAPCSGTVSKVGYPYASDLSYRYVEIRHQLDGKTFWHRLFYVAPAANFGVGSKVEHGVTVIGFAQDVTKRYPELPAMQPHVHYEVRRDAPGGGFEYFDPLEPLTATSVGRKPT